MKKVMVIGSSNTDMVVRSARIPVPGETILGGRFLMNPGGKGANQAVAAARMGGDVTFIAKIGNDLFGRETLAAWKEEKINTQFVLTDPEEQSGVPNSFLPSFFRKTRQVSAGSLRYFPASW